MSLSAPARPCNDFDEHFHQQRAQAGHSLSAALVRRGLLLSGGGQERAVPLLAGAAHYWRLEPEHWRPALAAVKAMGFRFVDTYVPWSVHEQSDGSFDFGRVRPALDLALFLRIARELGLEAIVRPGPHINAELTDFGIPERVLWDKACQARGPSGAPVVLPFVPRMFPVPSYASDAYHAEVERFFRALGPVLAPLCQPHGPVALIQIDNEGALYFRDGVYDQDYHPDALRRFRAFLRERYGTLEALVATWGRVEHEGAPASFDTVSPPRGFDAETREELAPHLDWAEHQERLVAEGLGRFATTLREAGVTGVPTSHNFPMGQEATPLDAMLVGRSIDLVGLDYYNRAQAADRRIIGRRTSELALRCDGLDRPAFAPEMGAGFPPYFPPLSEHDSAFTLLAALAYGLRGYSLYMAVERDRWIGSPIDRRGRRRPSASFYEKLNAALERVGWFELRRRVPVRLVVPRAERRLARVLHAFGPVSGALLGVSGLGPREGALERDLGLEVTAAVEVDTLLRALEHALDARGVPYAVVGGEHLDLALGGASWVVVLTSGGFSDELAAALERAVRAGTRVTLGPALRRYDERFSLLSEPWSVAVRHLAHSDPRALDEEVARHVEALDLPRFACDPDGVLATVHEDADGEARVAFAINTTEADLVARITLEGDHRWEDVLDGETVAASGGVVELRLRPTSVRMLSRVR